MTCIHQINISDTDADCMSPDLIVGGRVPLSFCDACPYHTAGPLRGIGDVVERGLKTIGITKQRVAKVTGKPCGCKARQAKLNKLVPFAPAKLLEYQVPNQPAANKPESGTLQFVWCYLHRAAALDELRYSMRSVQANYQGKCSFLVIGDKPPWYDGPWIKQPRKLQGKGFRVGLRDMLSKMDTLSRHPDVADEFVWMMDDVFMVRSTSKAELMTPRAGIDLAGYDNDGNAWRSIKINTAKRLIRNGFRALDFGTHLPHYVRKSELLELFQTWKPLEHVFLWEVAYKNTFAHGHKPKPATPFLRRVGTRLRLDQYDRIAKRSNFVNIMAKGWKHRLRNWLRDRFPEPHDGERGPQPVEYFSSPAKPIDAHFVLVRSQATDATISRQRLDIFAQTMLPSLQQQQATDTPLQVVVAVDSTDPLLAKRKAAWQTCGHDVRFVAVDNVTDSRFVIDWQLPDNTGKRLLTRLDDDDLISVDFLRLTQAEAAGPYSRAVLEWPNGYVWHSGTLHRLRNPCHNNISIVTVGSETPYDADHKSWQGAWPVFPVNDSRGWVWVRHATTMTKTKPKYLRQTAGQPNAKRWAVGLSNICQDSPA